MKRINFIVITILMLLASASRKAFAQSMSADSALFYLERLIYKGGIVFNADGSLNQQASNQWTLADRFAFSTFRKDLTRVSEGLLLLSRPGDELVYYDLHTNKKIVKSAHEQLGRFIRQPIQQIVFSIANQGDITYFYQHITYNRKGEAFILSDTGSEGDGGRFYKHLSRYPRSFIAPRIDTFMNELPLAIEGNQSRHPNDGPMYGDRWLYVEFTTREKEMLTMSRHLNDPTHSWQIHLKGYETVMDPVRAEAFLRSLYPNLFAIE